jgi:hypothetical protein
MRRELACSVALASILLLVAATCAPARAATYTVGVSVGTTATYSASLTNANISSQNIEVLWTNLTAVRLASTYHYTNGTDHTRFDTWDVRDPIDANFSLGLSFEWLKVIAANLTAPDLLWPTGDPAPINSTTIMFVAGVIRTVHFWDVLDHELVVYWDKATGLMVKLNLYMGSIIGWLNYSMSATNAWESTLPAIPGYPLEAIGIALALGLLVGVLYRRKRATQP